MMPIKRWLILALLVACAACGGGTVPADTQDIPPTAPSNDGITTPEVLPETRSLPTSEAGTEAIVATQTRLPKTASPPAPKTPKSTLDPDAWTSLPVIPEVLPRVKEIYLHGLELGNNPRAFSKVGDCGSTPAWFLGDFDRGPRYYSLGEYQSLEAVIQEFQGSFDRTSLAAKSGFNASSVFTPLWANRKFCDANETPLACEYRLHRPAFAFIMLGTNDVWHIDNFEPQMRRIIEFSIENGVVPILSTKADNEEGNGSINATIASLAHEYDVPLLNYWLAVQPLPDMGLQEDKAHITWGPNRFDDPKAMEKGWPVRNLTALQVLDAVWRAVNKT
jgi:hypothetical protein